MLKNIEEFCAMYKKYLQREKKNNANILKKISISIFLDHIRICFEVISTILCIFRIDILMILNQAILVPIHHSHDTLNNRLQLFISVRSMLFVLESLIYKHFSVDPRKISQEFIQRETD